MASRGWVITGFAGLAGLIATPIADSLVKDGKLPDWLSPKVDGLLSVLSLTTPWALWELMLIVLGIGGIAIYALYRDSRTIRHQESRIASLSSEVDGCKQRCIALDAANAELKLSNVQFKASIVALDQQIRELPQGASEVDTQIPLLAFKVLEAIAMLTNAGVHTLLSRIHMAAGGSRVEIQASIDILIHYELVQGFDTPQEAMYELSSKGRAFYLDAMRSKEG